MPRPAILTLAALALPALAAAEEVENPIYKSWSVEKVGTVVAHRATSVRGGLKVETTTEYKLVALTPRRAVVAMTVVSDATGAAVKNPPQELEYRATFPLLAGVKKEEIGRPPGAVARGEEELEVAGKTYKAEWYDTRSQTEAGPAITRTWMAGDVPGKLLKSVTRVPKADKVTTLELVAIERP